MPLDENIKEIRRAIADIAPDRNVTIVAATKNRTPDEINALEPLGVFDYGENRVQEWRLKEAEILPSMRFHYIGQIQANKIKYLIGGARLIHSVDKASQLFEISRLAKARYETVDILIQVNTALEERKAGIAPEKFAQLAGMAESMQGIRLRGIMCIAPLVGGLEAAERAFSSAWDIYDKHGGFDIISMGMSQDYKAALRCGSNMIRIGSALFA